MEHLKKAIELRLKEIREEEEKLTALLNSYGIDLNGQTTKTERTRNLIRRMIEAPKSYHINDIQKRFEMDGIEFNKALVHQAIETLQDEGGLIKVKINGSNQRYYYMSSKAKNGGEYGIKDLYLPMDKKFIETIEIM